MPVYNSSELGLSVKISKEFSFIFVPSLKNTSI